MFDPISLGISAAALAISATAARYARHQAAAAAIAAGDVVRLQHERDRPCLVATAEIHSSEPYLVITNAGLNPAEKIHAHLRATKMSAGADSRVRALPETQQWSAELLDGFQSARTAIGLGALPTGQLAVVVLSASRDGRTWEWIAEVPIP